MPVNPVTFTSTNELEDAASTLSDKLFAVSDNAADTTQTLSVTGPVGGIATTESLSLLGKREVLSTNTFDSLTLLSLSAACAGTLHVYEKGVSGQLSLYVSGAPANGDTLTLGLTGFTQTYTFRNPSRATFLCPAGAALVTGAAAGSYVKITLNGVAKYFWFSNGATTDPAPGGTGYAVVFTGADADTVIAAALRASMVTNLTNYATSVSTATVTITGIALGAITTSQDAGADFTITAVAAGAADAANQIRTGWHTDGVAASIANVADYIERALDASTTAGQHFGTGTVANAFLTVVVTNGGLVTTWDRIPCARQLAWNNSVSSSAITLGTVGGGANGDLLATFTAGTTAAFDDVTLDSEALTDATLPGLFVGSSDSVPVGGRVFTIKHQKAAAGSNITFSVEESTDGGTTWSSLATGQTISNTLTRYTSSHCVEDVRCTITVNANTSSRALNMKVIA